jgi:hypothetical protein
MKQFIIRIRLENASNEMYVSLVKILIAKGYSVKIISKENQSYILPLGNFFIESLKDKYELLENTKNMVLNFWSHKYQILVTETNPKGNAWCGLLEG